MNYEIYEKTISGMFITAFFCILDNAHRILHYSCAGHNRPILYRASNNSIIELDAEGLPLGLDAENPLVPQQIQLKKGDRILFYTDALIESSNEKNGMFGLARLYKYMEQTHKIKAELFTQNLINIIKNHSSHYQQTGNFEDDLTLIVLDVK